MTRFGPVTRFGLALAAILAVVTVAAPLTASAADKPGPYSSEAIAQGKKEAPAVLAASGAPCTLTDAAFVGTSTGKDDKGKEVKQSIYEVSCKGGLGYDLVSQGAGAPKPYDCLALLGSPSLQCRLPENLDPKRSLQPMVSQLSSQCTVADARYLGSKPNGESYYEVGCGAAPGFIVHTTPGQAAARVGCDQVSAAMACKFTTQAQLDAAATAAASALVAKSGKTCQITGSRTIGELKSGDMGYEVACSNGSGYVLEAKPSGDFDVAINCANAGDACKLTDSTKAETAETGTYTRLAKAGGFNCSVTKYRFVGIDEKNKSEVVELQCANRADGAFGVFPTDNKSPAKFYDCVAVAALGQSCKLTDPSAVYGNYTQALIAKGKKTCKVTGAHWLGVTQSGDSYVETACSDGLPGWVVLMTPAGSASEVLNCAQAKGSGVVCTLPGNTKG